MRSVVYGKCPPAGQRFPPIRHTNQYPDGIPGIHIGLPDGWVLRCHRHPYVPDRCPGQDQDLDSGAPEKPRRVRPPSTRTRESSAASLRKYRRCLIGRPVIHNEQFKIMVCLSKNAFRRFAQKSFPIMDRHENSDAGRSFVHTDEDIGSRRISSDQVMPAEPLKKSQCIFMQSALAQPVRSRTWDRGH